MPSNAKPEKIPITLLTGFLGSGKTTLLNRILTENHGMKIAVIENEFGEVGIDHDLVIGAEEELFEMNNGCICCTVRGDLLRILGALLKRKDKLDRILIETTGMADPGPVAQTFFLDDELKLRLELDAIITLVDVKHVHSQLASQAEARAQVAFADVLVLNKTDLISPAEADRIEIQLQAMNRTAKVIRSQMAEVDLRKVLDLKAFALERALEVDAGFLEPEYPFEAALAFDLKAGDYVLQAGQGQDPTVQVAGFFEAGHADAGRVEPSKTRVVSDAAWPTWSEKAVALFSALRDKAPEYSHGDALKVMPGAPAFFAWRLPVESAMTHALHVHLQEPGTLRLFTQHAPDEFALTLLSDGKPVQPTAEQAYKATHDHDDAITSVGIECDGELDPNRFNAWLSKLLQEKGTDIYRSKGVLALQGEPNRYVFQGVHMLLDFASERPWGKAKRQNRLVFIGKNLDREALRQGFTSCLAR